MWNYDEALSQLKLYPKDPYLQYVVLQLGRREQRLEEASSEIERLTGVGARDAANDRAQSVDLFNLFSGAWRLRKACSSTPCTAALRPARPPSWEPERGAATVQKMAPPSRRFPERKPTVKLADLHGPTIKSHPWQKMLAGRKPAISSLARCVPEDFYLVEFRSLSKLLRNTSI